MYRGVINIDTVKKMFKSLPSSWKLVKLEEILIEKLCNGLYKTEDFLGKGVLFLDINGLYKGLNADFSKARRVQVTESEHKKYEIKKEDILVNRVSKKAEGVGKAVLVGEMKETAVYESNMIRVRVDKKRVSPLFIVYYLSSDQSRQELLSKANVSNQASINQEAVKSLKIPLPPIDEQRRIAAILDQADAIRRKRQQAIALTDELLRSTFLEMFGDPVINPKGWEVRKLSELCSKITDGTHKTPTYLSSGIPFISAKNIKSGKINWENTKFISFEEHQALTSRCRPEINDVLLTKSGSIGVSAQ